MSSTPKQGRAKKAKKQSTFPLYLHGTGQWAKTIRDKKHYFGSDRDKALANYLAQKDYLLNGLPFPK